MDIWILQLLVFHLAAFIASIGKHWQSNNNPSEITWEQVLYVDPTLSLFHMRTLLWQFKTCVHTFSYSIASTLRALLNCIKLGSQSSPSWQWVMAIKLGSASMVMTKFTGTINHLQAARSLILHRIEREEGAGQFKNQQLQLLSSGAPTFSEVMREKQGVCLHALMWRCDNVL